PIDTNSTLPIDTNSTLPIDTNSTLPIDTNSTLPIDTNSTLPIIIPPIPDPVTSLDSDIVQNDTKYVGEVNLNQTGLVIDGGYVRLNGNTTNGGSNLTVSTWIKPNYQSGNPVYTIASKQNAFQLTLNNIADPKHKVQFSVFDGSKWYSVRSIVKITENWSYIAGTFDGNVLSLYVNGTLNSKFSISAANLERESHASIGSELVDPNSDVLVGAISDLRLDENTANNFYGSMDKFSIYDQLLTNEQIGKIYEDTLAEIENKSIPLQPEPVQNTEQVPINLLDQITNSTNIQTIQDDLNATNIELDQVANNTLDTNSTEFIVVPQFDTTNTFTLSVWVTPDYEKASDELTIFAKEKSFMLSLNNVIEPKHAPKLSVFDGIRWTDIATGKKVEGLTHIAAVINGTNVSLYVNGILEQQGTLSNSIKITEGRSILVPGEIADTDSNIVIGAYLSTLRSEPKLSNQFSGIIDEPQFFDVALDQSQIKAIYHQKIHEESSIQLDELVPIADELNTAFETVTPHLNNTINLNGTLPELVEIPIEPKLDSAKSTFLITENPEFELELFNDTAAILKQKQDLQIATSILANTTQALTENITNETDTPTAQAPAIFGWLFFIPSAHAEENQVSDLYIEDVKQDIQDLQNKVSDIDPADNNSKEAIVEAATQIKDVAEKIATIAENSQVNNDLQESLEKINEITNPEPEPVQEGQWVEDNNTITTEIYDPSGSVTTLHSTFEKVRDGKFKIALSSDDIKQPGLYKIKTIITIDGEQYTSEKEFAWGLVSLNTKKSIYKPGETADFVIVVLDNEGHPVCNANLSMDIRSPDSVISNLSSENGISANEECGLYDAQYITSSSGTYDVNIHASSTNVDTNFSTTFDVRNNFDFDIVRTAQSKIDPVNNPNSFNVTIDIESFAGNNPLEITEYVPSVFDIRTDGQVHQIGDRKVITWNKELIDGKANVSYAYSIPLEFPKLYALGPIEINSSTVFTEARNWFVAADPQVFNDGAGATLGGTCAPFSNADTLIASTGATSFHSGDNLLIASTQLAAASNNARTENVGIFSSTTLLASGEFVMPTSTTNQQQPYLVLDKDTGAAANPTYDVRGCRSGNTVNGEAKISAISGMYYNDYVDGVSTSITGGGGDITLATVSPTMPAGDNIVIATIQLSGATAQDLAAGNLKIKDGSGATVASNAYAISLGSAAPTTVQTAALIGYVSSASANPTYSVTASIGTTINGEAKILVIQSGEAYYSDGGTVAIGTSQTTIGTLNTSFASGDEVVVVAVSQIDDSDTLVETLAATTGLVLQESGTTKAANQYIVQALAASGSAGDGTRFPLVWSGTTSSASPQYTVKATASATGLNADVQMIAFKVQTPISLSESLSMTDTLTTNSEQSKSLSESLTLDDGTVSKTRDATQSLSESLTLDDGTVS
ncbi:MAG: LamG-like jellyroll fold domain-containing protein, partial [Candidatus Nitrosotenuis sp.]